MGSSEFLCLYEVQIKERWLSQICACLLNGSEENAFNGPTCQQSD